MDELRQAWEKQVVEGIKDRWQRLKQAGQRRVTPEGHKEALRERERQVRKRWSRVAGQVRAKDEEERKSAGTNKRCR